MRRDKKRAYRPDAQPFDRVEITTVPRYKTSGLSGDEWRISALIRVYRNGRIVAERGASNVETAAAFLPGFLLELNDDGKGYYASEKDWCDQEGCDERATVYYKKLADYCRIGHKTYPYEHDATPKVRQFCEQHKRRGDCGLDDADANYVRLDL